MSNEMAPALPSGSPFEQIKRVNQTGNEFWSSRDFACVLDYTDYRNFEAVIQKARMACFNSGQRIEDHFVDVTEMIELGKGEQRLQSGCGIMPGPARASLGLARS